MKKNDEVKDAEVVEDVKEEKKEKVTEPEKVEIKREEKKKKNGLIYVIVCVIILLIFGALVIALNNIGLIKFDNIDITPKSNTKLNYTETTKTKQKSVVSVVDVSGIVEEVMPSIVSITSKTLISSGYYGPSFFFGNGGEERYAEGAGSGIIVSQTDDEILILTNAHVVSDADELSVQFVDEKSVDATIKGSNETEDVAVISVKISDVDKDTLASIKIATIGDSNELKVGNGIIAIGNALGYGQSVTTGVVSALNRDVTVDNGTRKMIQIDAAINGGNSGGALLNSNGEVVGINSIKYSSSGYYSNSASIEGMGFAIPISDVKDLIEDLMNGKGSTEDTGDVQIGITGDMVSGEYTGFYISKVTTKNAQKAGLEAGYIVTKIEGKDVTSMDVVKSVLSTKKKGDKVTLTVAYPNKNSYKEKDVKVTLS